MKLNDIKLIAAFLLVWTLASDAQPRRLRGRGVLEDSEPADPPTPKPTESPTARPTREPTDPPTLKPTGSPTTGPTHEPTDPPTPKPTESPTAGPEPTDPPTLEPTSPQTDPPTISPTRAPVFIPTTSPTRNDATKYPTATPTMSPTFETVAPTLDDTTNDPTSHPTIAPTPNDTTKDPTTAPTPNNATDAPTMSPSTPTSMTSEPSQMTPTMAPTKDLTNSTFPAAPTLDLDPIPQVDIYVDEAAVAAGPALLIAKFLGPKLLDLAGSLIWNEVQNRFLGGNDLPSYFDQVFEEIQTIVERENIKLKLSDLKKMAAQFGNAMNLYNNMGGSEGQLLLAHDRANDILEESRKDYLQNQGAFFHAEANMYYIMVLQEKYKRMKDSGRYSEEELARARNNISSYARRGASQLRSMRNALHAERMSHVTEKYHDTLPNLGIDTGRTIFGLTQGVYLTRKHWDCKPRLQDHITARAIPFCDMFYDKFNGFEMRYGFIALTALECWDPNYTHNQVVQWREAYYNSLSHHTAGQLQPLLDVATSLDGIAANPVSGL